jgi:hypothetical protein
MQDVVLTTLSTILQLIAETDVELYKAASADLGNLVIGKPGVGPET